MLHPSHASPLRREKGEKLGKEGQERRLRQERKMELYGRE
jgi:hypothetical protein